MEEPEKLDEWIRERVLGSGGFGIVSLWKNEITNERIAIKKYRHGNQTELTQKHRDRWTQEVEMMQKITNENIVMFRVLPFKLQKELEKFNVTNLPMLSMEYCELGNLRNLLSKTENCCGLKEYKVRCVLSDLRNAVSYLHSLKITHRDLKPENIVLKSSGRPNGFICKLIDLGYAKEIDARSECGSFVGTLQYLAPELLYSKTYSCSVDYWSMGLLAFEIICGVRPFLPNTTPSKWMMQVHKKGNDVICIYEEDDEIFTSNEIYAENHISSCLKQEIEKWLRIALEYQPRKRGYIKYDPNKKENELAIFTTLEKTLQKKFVNVFVVYTLQRYSYEIDNCTQVSTMQGWIFIDTKIPITEQILLSDCCDYIDCNGLATQFFDKTYRNVMLYVFKKNEILKDDIKPNVPKLVQSSLEKSVANLSRDFQKRFFNYVLYFINKETNLYNTLLDACSLKLNRMCKTINDLCDKKSTDIIKLKAQKDYAEELLNFDLQQYLKNYSQKANHWSDSFKNITKNIEIVDETCSQIRLKGEPICRRVLELATRFDKLYSKNHNHKLNTLLLDARKYCSQIKISMKNNEYSTEYVRIIQNLFYQFIKERYEHLEESQFKDFLRIINETEKDINKLLDTIQKAITLIQKYQKELIEDHKNRQKKIWEFTIKQKPKSKTVDSKPGTPTINQPSEIFKSANFILGKQQTTSPYTNTESVFSQFSLMNNNYENLSYAITNTALINKSEMDEIIRMNMDLRFQIQEKTNESLMNFQHICSDMLDFSFLDDKN